MAKRDKHVKLKSKVVELARKAAPHQILSLLANEYKSYPRRSRNSAEEEFWVKVSRSTANLASGMEKWLEEWIDEEESEGEDEE